VVCFGSPLPRNSSDNYSVAVGLGPMRDRRKKGENLIWAAEKGEAERTGSRQTHNSTRH